MCKSLSSVIWVEGVLYVFYTHAHAAATTVQQQASYTNSGPKAALSKNTGLVTKVIMTSLFFQQFTCSKVLYRSMHSAAI